MLKYVGGGWLSGVPARDLTDEEAERYGGAGELVKSGLYVLSKKRKTGSKKDEVKHGRD